jgi:pilus assembly protein CpaB
MRRGRIFILLAIVIILALGGLYLVMQSGLLNPSPPTTVDPETGAVVPAQPEQPVDTVEIVVVAQDVPRGTVLTVDYLTTMDWPRDSVLDSMFPAEDMETSVVGRQARHDIDDGTPLTVSMLIDVNESLTDTGSIAALRIPRGMVAFPIPVDRQTSVAYAIRPGDHVSVIGSFKVLDIDSEFQSALPNSALNIISTGSWGEDQPSYLTILPSYPELLGEFVDKEHLLPKVPVGRTELDPLLNELVYVVPYEAQRPRLVTQILMQDAIVLKYGEFSYEDLTPEEPAPTETEEGEQAQGEQPVVAEPQDQPPDIVILIVTPQEAVALEYLLKGDIDLTLALRSSGDTDPIDTEAVTFQYMLETYNIPVPAKLPYGLEPGEGLVEPLPTEPAQ